MLEKKILNAFIGKVVRKDQAFEVKGGLPVPTYVLEYLLGQYCASDDPQVIEQGIEKVKSVIRNNYVQRQDAEQVKSTIREQGRYRVIDKVTAVLNEKNDEYQASFANLGLSGVPIGTQYVTQNPNLLKHQQNVRSVSASLCLVNIVSLSAWVKQVCRTRNYLHHILPMRMR